MSDCPRIYVASLTDYNCGRLHGVWIDLEMDTDYDDVMQAVEDMLAQSPAVTLYGESEVAEEFAIHDVDNFCGYDVHEYTSLREIVDVGAAIAEHGSAMAEWLESSSSDPEDAIDEFRDVFMGEWDSVVDWAYDEFQSCHPDEFNAYEKSNHLKFDHEGYVTTAQTDGYVFVDLGGGRVAVLNSHMA